MLHNFADNSDGGNPTGNVVVDKSGNVYGVTSSGGPHDYGIVYELSPGSKGSWTEKLLYAFAGGPDGIAPQGGLTMDGAGNLYGVATYVAFELSPNANGTWSLKLLHDFTGGSDGAYPVGGLAFDQSGNLYGTTNTGGKHRGTVFELKAGSSGAWTESILHDFSSNGVDGLFPSIPGLAVDSSGNVYGVTLLGGSPGLGVVFEVSP